MKKTYINPTTEIMNIQTLAMIASSNPAGFNGNLGDDSEGGDGGDALSRKHTSVWGDEEEEF